MARCALVLATVLGACASPPPVRTVPFVDDLLRGAREAVGLDALLEHPGGFELVGERIDARGRAPFRFGFDASGRSITDVAGARPQAEGFDGLRCWSQDPSGLVREVAFGEAERIRCEAWLRTGLWLSPWVPRFTVAVDRAASTPERAALVLARPDTPFRARVWIDTATSLPVEYEVARDARRVQLGDWGRVAGVRLPRRYVHALADGGQVVEELALTTPVDAPDFAPPRPRARDTSFEPLVAPEADSWLGPDGRLYAKAVLDGSREVTLLIDSGFGASALDPRIADELRWPRLGDAALDGVGGRGESTWRRAGALRLGPLTISGLELVELPPASARDEGSPAVDGVLGADVLARATFEFDLVDGRLAVHDPTRFRRDDLDWQPLQLDGAAPCVEARIGGSRPLWVRLDTGSADTLSVAPWAVAELRLAPSIIDLEAVHLVGPFGSVRGWRGELASVRLAGVTLPRVPATFLESFGAPGPLNDPWIAGNAGLPVLRSARVFLDLQRRRIAVVPPR